MSAGQDARSKITCVWCHRGTGLELVTHAAIGGERQTLFRHRGPCDVTAQSFQISCVRAPSLRHPRRPKGTRNKVALLARAEDCVGENPLTTEACAVILNIANQSVEISIQQRKAEPVRSLRGFPSSGESERPFSLLGPGLAHAIDCHGDERDAATAMTPAPEIRLREALIHQGTQSRGTHKSGDHEHRQPEHHGLVEP